MSANGIQVVLEFEIKGGVVTDETDAIREAIRLCEQNNSQKAAELLLPTMMLEWDWENCDGDPTEFFEEPKAFKLKCDSTNCVLEVGLNETKQVVITARVSFTLDAGGSLAPDELSEWLSEKSVYACAHVSGGWSYENSDEENVTLISVDGDAFPM